MFLDHSIKKLMGIVGLGMILHGGFLANAQTLDATLVETSKVTDFGLEFDNFRFGSRITPHGDCVDVINGYVFVTWYRGGMDDRHVMLSRKQIGSGTWKTIEFPHQHVGYRGDPAIGDSHNTIAVTICPIDNTVHMLYDMHAYNPSELPDDYFNYSVSIPNAAFVADDQWTLDLFLPKKNELEPNGNYIDVTYPKFNRCDDGSIIANWRNGGAGSGNSFYARYDGSTWSEPILFGKGIVSVPSDRWSIYGKLKYEGGNLGYGFSIRWGGARDDDIPYNSGFYYAEAKPPYGAGDWYDIDGNPITLPVTNPDVIKVGEPTDLGLGKQITGGADWTRTKNGAVHFMTVVEGSFVHYYRPVGSNTFIVDLNSPLSDMYPAGEYVLMADSSGGRPYIRVAPEGTKNWQVIHNENTGPSMDYYNVDLEGDTLVYYSRESGGTTVEPLHVTAYTLDIPGIENPDYNTDPTSGLVAHWPLDEMSGTVVTNLADSSYTAHIENGATWDSDATRDSYVVFDGTDDRIATTFRYALADTNNFTWAWWAKMEPTSHPGSIMVGNRYPERASPKYGFIKMTPQGAEFANTASAATIDKYDYADLPQNEWHHYAMVKDGTSYQWYVDGVAQGVASNFVYNETSPIPFMIGGDDNGTGKPNEHFEGCIDDVVLYREALTPTEVADVRDGNYPYAPPVYELIAGWDTWDSSIAPAASVLAPHVTGSAVTTTEGLAWHTTDERGASNDGDWGTFVSIPSASTVTNVDNENLELPNATTGGTITFTITNNGTDDIELGAFHFDTYAFRPKAARTYELSVLPGGGISTGVVFTSASQAITDVGGAWDNGAHDDIDLSLTELADHTLGAGESVQFLLAFSGGAGDGSGGHDLWVDNVAISKAFEPPVLELNMNGGDMVFDWTGSGFKVQTRTNLTEGTWQDVTGGNMPPVTNSTTEPAAFFRLIED